MHLAYAEAGPAGAGAPAEAWPAMARAFEAFLLGVGAPLVRPQPLADVRQDSLRGYYVLS